MLSIAGTDPTGGAGTAADLKSITAAGGYGMSVVTTLVAQNTHGVRDLHVPPAEFLAAQLHAVSDDVTLEAVKTGMLGTADIIATVSEWLEQNPPSILVVDPVMIATSGDRLLQPEAEQAMVAFCRRATVVTPNIDELAVLTGQPRATTEEEALDQAARWSAETGVAVVVKTGHLDGRRVTNTWVGPDGTLLPVPSTRVDTTSTHGTGCSLSSALATRLGRGDTPEAALAWATYWLHEAILHGAALQLGSGHGPVDHSHRSRRLQAAGAANPWLAYDPVPPVLEAPQDLGAPRDPDIQRDRSRTSHVPATATPAVAPVGPWTAALWEAGTETTMAIGASDFVQALVEGSLSEADFTFYLAQDALYLNRYARALAALAARSSSTESQQFWFQASTGAITEEADLHRTWIAARPEAARTTASPVTSAYTDFLLATTLGEDRAVGAAAVLPCFWLYAQVGGAIPDVPANHPYAAWLDTYRDPGFVAAVQGALEQVEHEFAGASPTVRAAAARAYLIACRHELEFFEQATRLEPEAAAPPQRSTEAVPARQPEAAPAADPAGNATADLSGAAR
ncbi:bifunctional hydroxymethylpyrimidine kinase/phosphomethylpyrimidine kinase [Citricoccus sp.]|uniref:bifunctional hydroxymethylpyrimidine kinase/phosphomethylpyrimidine kinase n=1 Tax=Citricoccus sp. TaxID=1978372 RepID=UPI0028BDC8EC|nr:bifunctional hydroxymethylpyrimidine kinase/phosphomethylpyrimidine kinase [Citricoccus sp.]